MIISALFKFTLVLLQTFLGWVNIYDFGLSDTFSTYITWFYGFIDSALTLFAFLVPQPVFYTSIALFLAIHEFEHFLELIRFIISKFPGLSGFSNRS